VTITNESLEQVTTEENVDIFKKPRIYLAIRRPPNWLILFMVELTKCQKY
jgi:hypothetical protein